MTDKPLVFILVLNWNGWKDTLRCVESINRTAYSNYKVVVIDNGSIDGSVSEILAVYPNLDVIENQQNLGFAGGNNPGIRYALNQNAEFLLLLNNDACLEPDTLGKMVSTALGNDKIGAVGAIVHDAHHQDHLLAWGGGGVSTWTSLSWHATKPGMPLTYLSGVCLLIRREALMDVGLLDDRYFFYWEDTDFSYRLRNAGWRLAVAEDAHLSHIGSASIGAGSYLHARYFMNGLVKFMRTHASLPIVPITLALLTKPVRAVTRGQWAAVRGYLQGWWEGIRVNPRPGPSLSDE